MKFLEDAFKQTGTIHHAYVVTGVTAGERERAVTALETFLEATLKFRLANNPDFFKEQFDIFGIDDARRVKAIHSSKAFSVTRIFFILTNGFTLESQNALLKIFEEPHQGNHFFVLMPSAHVLLPTLRSRVVIAPLVIDSDDHVDSSDALSATTTAESKYFIESSLKNRMKFVTDFASSISDEKKTKADAIVFLDNLERELRSKKTPTEWTKKDTRTFATIATAKDYLYDRASSVKMLLEHVALSFE